jgi:hypothetical protein
MLLMARTGFEVPGYPDRMNQLRISVLDMRVKNSGFLIDLKYDLFAGCAVSQRERGAG